MMCTTTRRRFLEAAGTLGLAGVIAGCMGGDGDEGDNELGDVVDDEATVTVGPDSEFRFDPKSLAVEPGTEVTFVWDSNTHNVIVDEKPEGADWAGVEDIENRGFEHRHTFETPGDYEYYCSPHRSQGMTGSITVVE